MSVLPGPGRAWARGGCGCRRTGPARRRWPGRTRSWRPAPPGRGSYVGTDAFTGAPFCFDPWTLYAQGWLTNPNVLLAGVIGQGKSALAKTLAIRSIAAGRRGVRAGRPEGGVGPGRRRGRRHRGRARPGPADPAQPPRRGRPARPARRPRRGRRLHRPLAPAEHTALAAGP